MYTKLCTKLWVAMDSLKRDARGVSGLEYGILAAIVVAALVTLVTSDAFTTIFSNAKTAVENAATATTPD